ncbi:hypothetical protein MA16_Dca012478 [Dendrobium catenatum]|uniref:Uncharacterized protein n=1 Tax=Dendrobium catenatum TaxID=906689 RepID=A0A2I0XD36_9ASPA|nr:hypothetical protein MA16_Dca012478 [Dendrobium catenatum]
MGRGRRLGVWKGMGEAGGWDCGRRSGLLLEAGEQVVGVWFWEEGKGKGVWEVGG